MAGAMVGLWLGLWAEVGVGLELGCGGAGAVLDCDGYNIDQITTTKYGKRKKKTGN